MYTLGFDSTSTTASVAVVKDGKIIANYNVESGNTHSTTLLPMAEHVLRITNLSFDDIDIYGCAVGPGSFTGLRIGVATVKGLCFKDKKPSIPISSLEALAFNFYGSGNKYVCPVINARRERVYSALFELKDGILNRIWEDTVIEIAELKQKLSEYDSSKIYYCGDAYSLIDFKNTETPVALRSQLGSSVALLSEFKYKNNIENSFLPEDLLPVYLQKTQAEREREQKLQNGEV